jgi:hypothetical protein
MNHDLAIRWSDESSSVRRLQRSGSVPIHAFPRHFRPGGIVAIVSKNNEIRLMFKAVGIDGPQRVTLANGKSWPNGYLIRSAKKTMREPQEPLKAPIKGWYSIGAFRYFNAAKMRAILVGDNFGSGKYIEELPSGTSGIVFQPHVQGIPGLPHNHPESVLVDQYVSWMREETHFADNYIREAKLRVDLFDLTHWQLLEAKAVNNREAIRMAIGQLRDYKRYYHERHPSLAVLLSSRPAVSCIKLLTDNRIAVIWRTPGGRFSTKRWQPEEA